MSGDWKPEYGVIIPSEVEDLAEMWPNGQLKCPGRMREGPMLRQEANRLDPSAPRHKYRGAPEQVPCGSKSFALSFWKDDGHLYIACDKCGEKLAIVQVKGRRRAK